MFRLTIEKDDVNAGNDVLISVRRKHLKLCDAHGGAQASQRNLRGKDMRSALGKELLGQAPSQVCARVLTLYYF